MGKISGFLEKPSKDRGNAPASERIKHYNEFAVPLNASELSDQGARCMDCGIPFCQNGCPINNIIPDWNDLVYRGEWKAALDVLHSTNNFPEFTGRICPAPCEASCTLNIIDDPVTIKTIEGAVIDRGWEEGWVVPRPPDHDSGRTVAVIGAGPAGLACAQQLARAGHNVTVFEKNQKPGGLLRYGIPDFKMEKHHINRRVAQMETEGVTFRTGVAVGQEISIDDITKDFDAVVLSGGSEQGRDLPVPGRELNGIHQAMEFLPQQNRRNSDEDQPGVTDILATEKHVLVIGGGDTGSDCIGTSVRQGAKSVTQLEIMPRPPEAEDKGLTWPDWPLRFRTSTSQNEGAERDWSVATDHFSGVDGTVSALHAFRVDGKLKKIDGSDFEMPADLVLMAMGFLHPTHDGMINDLGVAKDGRGNVKADTNSYQTSQDGVFAAGDMRRGQSLVVWAIREGRQCARAVDEFLMGCSNLPR
jgi:glutamate synthase (NADPH/NADH) small chain